MRKVLCSIGSGPHEELLEVASETYRVFADRHGYDLELRTELLVPERPASWSKVVLLRQLLDEYDFAFWIDADAAIVDVSVDVADEMERGKFLYVVAHEYDDQVVPNLGVIGMKTGRRARKFLDLLWNDTRYIDHKWWENAAALRLLGYDFEPVVHETTTPWFRRTKFIPKAWNSIAADAAEHPRINHYPGRSHEFRLEHLRSDAEHLRSSVAAG
ncbi:MAG: hypothetical protein M5U31_01750 [Acidimicrobiia bacterium]|nr:hypothetical protein [Acidimicrobiia bacterium]